MKAATFLTGLILAAASTASASTTIYFDNTFSTENPGSTYAPVNVSGAGAYNIAGGMTMPTEAVGNNQGIGRGAVVFPAGTAGFATQAVGLYSLPFGYGGGDTGGIKIEPNGITTPLTGTTTGQYVYSFDISFAALNDTSAWHTRPSMALRSNWGSGADQGFHDLLNFSYSGSNLTLDSSALTPGGTLMTSTIVSSLSTNTPYHIAATLDMDAKTFTVAVDGAPVGGTFNQLFVSATSPRGLGGYNAYAGMPSGTSPYGTFVYYDNINLQTASVPEPASLALGLVGMGLILLRRRA